MDPRSAGSPRALAESACRQLIALAEGIACGAPTGGNLAVSIQLYYITGPLGKIFWYVRASLDNLSG